MPQYRNGQSVLYKPIGGRDSNTAESTGTIRSVLTEPGNQAGRNVQASEDDPRYEIENNNTGKSSTIYESNILGPA
ncbi:DUF2945 domain-containing protein [Aspergillus clavatus NRRL 1]|uniref:Hypervirulence associated protein TUDOR domain-containing protein n=1 Tax=Aspergillus clavatus (strain ATCC 1007 / CBS 513.65 / DSM 816 / NCTC 3887 / NRRL 1 / QM 1276 / 107) TaxID=344612 RepID=A1CLV7_ASPCL|nr:uncharacterized protein ACLA_078340 [Aspergillus clavatus NRRL 1]EAW09086.1 conserved hypothetical protein [Aspergillus clavatus NRRL 1]